MKTKDFKNGYDLFQYAQKIIPGGSQLFGKRADLYAPGLWPSYYSNASGCTVTDLGGQEYYDFTMVGTGTSVLGYANADINTKIVEAISVGTICTLNNTEEVELAEFLLDLHPGMEMVRYARSGGEILSIAIRTARAYTGNDKVAICGYHGWHDWYLSTNLNHQNNLDDHLLPNLIPNGVPRAMMGLTEPFDFNDPENLNAVLQADKGNFAAVVLEPFRDNGPADGYLEAIREICDVHGVVLIFDEVTSGFRETLGGMYTRTNVKPDLVTFGKALSNGIPMAALVGNRKTMSAFTSTFVSSTYWGDKTGPAAALATISFMKRHNTAQIIHTKGLALRQILENAAAVSKLDITISGMPSLISFKLHVPDWPAALTFIIQEMLEKGFLANDRVYANLAHTEEIMKLFSESLEQVFTALAGHLKKDNLSNVLKGRVKDMGFNKTVK